MYLFVCLCVCVVFEVYVCCGIYGVCVCICVCCVCGVCVVSVCVFMCVLCLWFVYGVSLCVFVCVVFVVCVCVCVCTCTDLFFSCVWVVWLKVKNFCFSLSISPVSILAQGYSYAVGRVEENQVQVLMLPETRALESCPVTSTSLHWSPKTQGQHRFKG